MGEITIDAPDGGWGWVIAGCSFVIHALSVGNMFSLSVLYVSWLDEFESSKGVTSWIISVGAGVMFGIGPVPASLMSRFGHQAVVVTGGLLSCAGFVIAYFATNVFFLIICIGLIVGSGFGFCYLPAITVVAIYFDKRRSFALGIGTAGVGIGSFILAPFFHWLTQEYGWRGAVLITAAVSLHLCVCGLLMRPLPSSTETIIDDENDDDALKEKLLQCESELVVDEKSKAIMDSEVKTTDTQDEPPHPHLTEEDLSLKFVQNVSADKCRTKKFSLPDQELGRRTNDSTFPLGGSLQVISPLSELPNDNRARYACSAMDVRTTKNKDFEIFLNLGNADNPSHSFQREIRDVLRTGSIHSLALIGRRRQSSMMPIPKLIDQNAVQISEPLCYRCEKGLTKVFGSFISSFALLRRPVFSAFVVSNFLANLTYFMPVLYMMDRALDNNIEVSAAAFLVSLNGAGNIFGRVFFGFISDRSCVDCLVVYIICLIVCGLATSFSPLCGASVVLHSIYAITFGCFMGGYVTLAPIVTVDLMGVALVNESYGIILLFMGTAGVAGPPLAGWIFDWTGDFTTSYILHGIFVLISAAVMLPVAYCRLIRKCRQPEADEKIIQ